ncbi:MAG: hypothetical protein KAJ48_08195 [Elusimicrobiales bacterium]|nr:hypothetical protein [Elusimicrobiales bacterium]
MIEFTISDDPFISIYSDRQLYEDFKGVSVSTSSTLGRNIDFEFKDGIAGISSVDIEWPDGNIWTRTFDSPVESTSTLFTDMPLGQYTAKTKNSTGNEKWAG